eukprot:c19386_g1_i1.p1 GENE.c19386_g1_i1~~c19386_g1_i1.p1  ORF type:complete len:148 (+),score=22.88 c19386_g1_i1:413-856(+)
MKRTLTNNRGSCARIEIFSIFLKFHFFIDVPRAPLFDCPKEQISREQKFCRRNLRRRSRALCQTEDLLQRCFPSPFRDDLSRTITLEFFWFSPKITSSRNTFGTKLWSNCPGQFCTLDLHTWQVTNTFSESSLSFGSIVGLIFFAMD